MKKINQKIPTTNNQTPKSINCRGGRLYSVYNCCDKIRDFDKPANKGITLVALVITIIILIILAGVTLNIAIDQNGIIGKAKEGTSKYHNAQISEQQQILNMENYINSINSFTGSGVELVTFTIDGTTYYFEYGMNWDRWVNSPYNTIGLYLDENDYVVDSSMALYISGYYVLGGDPIRLQAKYEMAPY